MKTLPDLKAGSLRARWLDSGREPQCPPNPDFPNGKPVDCRGGTPAVWDQDKETIPSCAIDLTHPTPRCGLWYVACDLCGFSAVVTTAGRPDDPSLVIFPCKIEARKQ
jgi:hypothetical protein